MITPSIVAQTFGTGGKVDGDFVVRWLPKEWYPEIQLPGYWNTDSLTKFEMAHTTRVIKLKNFSSALLDSNADPTDSEEWMVFKKRYKGLRDTILRWLYNLEDAGKISIRNSGGLGTGTAFWQSFYLAEGVEGIFSVTIVSLDANSAMLTASLTETCLVGDSNSEKEAA